MGIAARLIIVALAACGSSQHVLAGPVARTPAALSVYIANDSINGLKFSDGYETHNAGVIWQSDAGRVHLDTAIVSPKLERTRKPGWQANRAYGELVSLTLEKPVSRHTMLGLSYVAADHFGFDNWQNRIHDILGYAGFEEDMRAVRMPDRQWLGVTIRQTAPKIPLLSDAVSQKLNWHMALGGAQDSIGLAVASEFWPYQHSRARAQAGQQSGWHFGWRAGLDYVARDTIVSAPPINADHRKWRPHFGLSVSRQVLGWQISFSETANLPTVKSDDSVFLALRIGLTKHFTGTAIK